MLNNNPTNQNNQIDNNLNKPWDPVDAFDRNIVNSNSIKLNKVYSSIINNNIKPIFFIYLIVFIYLPKFIGIFNHYTQLVLKSSLVLVLMVLLNPIHVYLFYHII
jgi:Gpi18-like mannosyltransferase